MRISDWSSDVCSSDLEVERDQRRFQLVGAWKVEDEARIFRHRGDRLHSRELLRARLRLLRGRRARAVACDIILQLRALRILRRLRRRKLRDALGALALEVVVAARIERHLAALDRKST